MAANKTRIYKGLHGWQGESFFTAINGYDWKITTMKRNSGQIISNAQGGNHSDAGMYEGFSFAMFTDPSINLLTVNDRATETAIKDAHYKALVKFDELQENNKLPFRPETSKEQGVRVGTVLFTDGPGYDPKDRVVYKIEDGSFGKIYRSIELKTFNFRQDDGAKPISKKFGIGVYYEPNKTLPQKEIDELLFQAMAKASDDKKRAAANEDIARIERATKLEEGAKLVSIPKWAQAVIVADMYEDKSDGMTDYFHTSASGSNRVFLAFSKTFRNNMPELKSAAENFESTAQWGVGKGIFKIYAEIANEAELRAAGLNPYNYSRMHLSDISDKIAEKEFTTKQEAEAFVETLGDPPTISDQGHVIRFKFEVSEISTEHKDGHSQLPNYYLGTERWHGWKVHKLNKYSFDTSKPASIEQLYVAAAEGRYKIPATGKTSATTKETAPIEGLDFNLKETTHAKKGYTLYVAVPSARVSKEDYKQLLGRAKIHNGYYSAYRGHGAIPGFQFKSAEDRAAFIGQPAQDTDLLALEAEALLLELELLNL
jgi:hypothetical protein